MLDTSLLDALAVDRVGRVRRRLSRRHDRCRRRLADDAVSDRAGRHCADAGGRHRPVVCVDHQGVGGTSPPQLRQRQLAHGGVAGGWKRAGLARDAWPVALFQSRHRIHGAAHQDRRWSSRWSSVRWRSSSIPTSPKRAQAWRPILISVPVRKVPTAAARHRARLDRDADVGRRRRDRRRRADAALSDTDDAPA